MIINCKCRKFADKTGTKHRMRRYSWCRCQTAGIFLDQDSALSQSNILLRVVVFIPYNEIIMNSEF